MGHGKSPLRKKTVKEVNVNRSGQALLNLLQKLSNRPTGSWTVGQRVWVKATGYCDWPGVIWNLDICLKKLIPELVHTHTSGSVLIRFYGDQTSMWCSPSSLKPIDDGYERRCGAMRQWSKKDKKRENKAKTALEELETSSADCESELQRMLQLQNSSLALVEGALSFTCTLCEEDGAKLKCRVCERRFHPLCLTPAGLTAPDLPNGGSWSCPSCGEENHANNNNGHGHGHGSGNDWMSGGEDEKVERMGLTPDWIIHAGAFKVFQLQQPTTLYPYIRGLLDPCTNSKVAPNIPAEVIYDKNDDGLKRCNSWEGYYIVLNPDFKAQIQWRFVNRAIDEVENDKVPGVLLICRNSTDTAYFQRLMPYPRVLLRRNSIRFKDYDKTPIGFGIVVFCIVKRQFATIIKRFMEQFAPYGEPNIVMDKEWLMSRSFSSLLGRLFDYANEHHRDNWIQCYRCKKWRIVSYEALLNARNTNWECKNLHHPFTSCRTSQTKNEIMGARYAVLSEENTQAPVDEDIKMEESEPMMREREKNVEVVDDEIQASSKECETEKTVSFQSQQQHQLHQQQAMNWLMPPLNHLWQMKEQKTTTTASTSISNMNTTHLFTGNLNVKLVVVDQNTYKKLLQLIQSPLANNACAQKRQSEDTGNEEQANKKSKSVVTENKNTNFLPNSAPMVADVAAEGKSSMVHSVAGVVKKESNGEVRSALEMSREASKAAIQNYFDSALIHREKEDFKSFRLHEAQLQEAARAVEIAKEQVAEALLKEKQIKEERAQLEISIRQRCEEFKIEEKAAEEYLLKQQLRMTEMKNSVNCR